MLANQLRLKRALAIAWDIEVNGPSPVSTVLPLVPLRWLVVSGSFSPPGG
jgi:hypothetical protein